MRDPTTTARAARAHRLPEGWTPSADDIGFATMCGFSEAEAENIAARFSSFWHSASGSRACKRSWAATWRCWCRRQVQSRARHRIGPQVRQ